MTAWVAFAVLAGWQGPAAGQSLFQKLGIQPTGRNGYEEYLMACDSLTSSGAAAEIGRLNEPNSQGSYLSRCRSIAAKSAPALQWVRAGNFKPVFDPRTKVGMATEFPELFQLRNLARAAVCDADVRFAEGDTAGGVDSLLAALECSDNFCRFTLIGGLVGIASDQIVLVRFASLWQQVSQRDCRTIRIRVDRLLAKPSSVRDILASEFRISADVFRTELPRAESLESILGVEGEEMTDSERHLLEQWKSLPPAERVRIGARLAEAMDAYSARFLQVVSGPESRWKAPERPPLSALEDMLFDTFAPAYNLAITRFAARRTQFRLLRLHAAIDEFRFEHGQLPESLEKLGAPREYLDDPLSGKPFAYEPQARNQYRLYSFGSEATGQVELAYRPARADSGSGPTVPPGS